MEDKIYKVFWSKAYYMSGTKEISAQSSEETLNKIDTIIGDFTGSMQYCPDDNIIEIDE